MASLTVLTLLYTMNLNVPSVTLGKIKSSAISPNHEYIYLGEFVNPQTSKRKPYVVVSHLETGEVKGWPQTRC